VNPRFTRARRVVESLSSSVASSSDASESESESESETEFESESDLEPSTTHGGGLRKLWQIAGEGVLAARAMLRAPAATKEDVQNRRTPSSGRKSLDESPAATAASSGEAFESDVSVSYSQASSGSESEPSESADHARPTRRDGSCSGRTSPRVRAKRAPRRFEKKQKRVASSSDQSTSDSEWDIEAARTVPGNREARKPPREAARRRAERVREAPKAKAPAKAPAKARRDDGNQSRVRDGCRQSLAGDEKITVAAFARGSLAPRENAVRLPVLPSERSSLLVPSEDETPSRGARRFLKKQKADSAASVTRYVALSALALLGVVMLSAGAHSVFLANATDLAVSTDPRPGHRSAPEESHPSATDGGASIAAPAPAPATADDSRVPRITPEMTYDERQAEYARFEKAAAERTDRVAAEAREAERRLLERGFPFPAETLEVGPFPDTVPAAFGAATAASGLGSAEKVAPADETPRRSYSESTGSMETPYPSVTAGEAFLSDIPEDSSGDVVRQSESAFGTPDAESRRSASVTGIGMA
jgi:hypothetical protein